MKYRYKAKLERGVPRKCRVFLVGLFLFTFFVFGMSLSYTRAGGLIVIPLISSNQNSTAILEKGKELRLLMWNVAKFADSSVYGELGAFLKSADFVLIQEDVHTPSTLEFYKNQLEYFWQLAKTFLHKWAFPTGVSIGSKFYVERSLGYLSSMKELGFFTRKATAFAYFPIKDSEETLLVANIHAINFLPNNLFKKHIDEAVSLLEKHEGPIIWGGDFNTWNKLRLQYLDAQTQSLGMQLSVPGEKGPHSEGVRGAFQITLWKGLGHIATRGVDILWHRVDLVAKGSDHQPHEMSFRLK